MQVTDLLASHIDLESESEDSFGYHDDNIK